MIYELENEDITISNVVLTKFISKDYCDIVLDKEERKGDVSYIAKISKFKNYDEQCNVEINSYYTNAKKSELFLENISENVDKLYEI